MRAAPPHSRAHPLYRSNAAYEAAMRDYDAALSTLAVPYESRYIPTRHGFTHVVVSGTAGKPPVVLWHGMNVNLTMWCALMNLLAPDYHLFAVDTIGNQGRSAPNRPNKRSPAHSEWTLDVVNGLALEPAHHVGFSQGGWLIFRLAEVAAERIRSAALLSCAGLVPVDYRLLLRMAPALLYRSPEARARAMIRFTSAPHHHPTPYEVRVFMSLQAYRVEGRVPVLSDEQIRRLTCPVTLIMGAQDHTFDPWRAVKRFHRLLPHGEAVLFDGLSHGLEEDRARVYDHLRAFLARQG